MLAETLSTLRDLVDARLDELLPPAGGRPPELHGAMRYSALAPGKRLRPILCLMSARAVGGAFQDALDAACAIEMIHAFSLIHDDLPAIDNDDLRRGLPTCHVKFGEAIAILAGDALFACAMVTIARADAGAAEVLAIATQRLSAGEAMDVLLEGKAPDAEALEFIHANKTGALIEAACEIGGRLGGGDARAIELLRGYGREIGLAFQIADDVLNETSTAEQLGKASGSDRSRGKQTFPARYGVERSRIMARESADRGIALVAGLPGEIGPLQEIANYAVNRAS